MSVALANSNGTGPPSMNVTGTTPPEGGEEGERERERERKSEREMIVIQAMFVIVVSVLGRW